MEPRLITSDEELRKYIPNVVTEVEGEDSLFDKIVADILLAEDFFEQGVSAIDILQQHDQDFAKMIELAKKIVAYKAFVYAIPKLDIILTQNGFGIVSNGNVAPASKERLERLMASLKLEADDSIDMFLNIGLSNSIWREDPKGGKLHMFTIFRGLEAQRMQRINVDLWDTHKQQLHTITGIEDMIAREYVSEDVMTFLRQFSYMTVQGPKGYVQNMLKTIIVSMIESKDYDYKSALLRLVDFIKANIDHFPTWKDSYAGIKFSDHTFVNHKSSAGFWL